MAEVAQLTEVLKGLMAVLQGGGGGGGVGGAGGERFGRREEDDAKQQLWGKDFEMLKGFSGGEAELQELSADLLMLVEMRSPELGKTMDEVKKANHGEKEVMTTGTVKEEIMLETTVDMQDGGEEYVKEKKKWDKLGMLTKELYRRILLSTDGEAKTMARRAENYDGLQAWGLLHAKYNQKTLSRMMRLQQECMYPKAVKVKELGNAILAWEEKWRKMIDEQPKGTNIPELWKMAAMLKLCPKEIQDMVDLRWDEVGEKYEVLKDRVIGWATTKAEGKGGGAVPMDVDGLEEGGDGWDDEWGDDGGGTIGAVYPTTKCYFCQGFGHMARECPQKGKGKGKDGGKGGGKGKGGFEVKGMGKGWKGGLETKGAGKGAGWKGGYEAKGGGKGSKGKGYQGTCYSCGKV